MNELWSALRVEAAIRASRGETGPAEFLREQAARVEAAEKALAESRAYRQPLLTDDLTEGSVA